MRTQGACPCLFGDVQRSLDCGIGWQWGPLTDVHFRTNGVAETGQVPTRRRGLRPGFQVSPRVVEGEEREALLERKEKEAQKTEEEMYEKFKERLNNETVKPEEEQGKVDPQEQERQRKLQARKRAIFGM